MPESFHIDPDITRAETLPASLYRDVEFFHWSREQIFARSWQLAGDLDMVKTPKQVYPFTFLEGCVDEPLLLTRDADDQLHCISNVCTHRGTVVVDQPCKVAHLRCPYHGRRFSLDGRFEHMPEFEKAQNFPSSRDDLQAADLETLGQFIFASIDPLFSFDVWMKEVRGRVGFLPFQKLKLDPSRCRDYLVQANWMLYVENYLEGFHIPFVHASLNEVVDYGAYRTEVYDWSNLQLGVVSGAEATFDLPRESKDFAQHIGGYYYWLWPNLMLNVYPWGVSVNVVKPLSVARTKIAFLCYVWDESMLDQGAGSSLDRVEREDEVVVESVMRGIQSRLYRRGRYSPTREQGVHHFHSMIDRCIRTNGFRTPV